MNDDTRQHQWRHVAARITTRTLLAMISLLSAFLRAPER